MSLASRFLRRNPFFGSFGLLSSPADLPKCQKILLPFCQAPMTSRWYKYSIKPLAPVPKPKPLDAETLPCSGVFSPSVCSFIAERDYENHNSGILAWVTSFTGENPVGLIELNKFVFGANPRIDILQRVVVWQRAKRRAGTACVKTRSEKRGGGRKPWQQKGTGRARQGSIRAPHFIGGGHAHGPKPKSFYYSLPKKVRRMGLRTALSVRYAQVRFYNWTYFDIVTLLTGYSF
ncbi:PREDICTED: 50S ribosomal protein L4-like isoform X2 [Acropora digitifera]|uniref:50S ribosomal protein L4-like isoform X2 n=1 Tax=Acropora digitifera TaxID=70779 RepID=UPI00077A1040|nr:PREDICTED: 50S ribosomal protein L4-like isoform X2 [Acropora digitifera]